MGSTPKKRNILYHSFYDSRLLRLSRFIPIPIHIHDRQNVNQSINIFIYQDYQWNIIYNLCPYILEAIFQLWAKESYFYMLFYILSAWNSKIHIFKKMESGHWNTRFCSYDSLRMHSTIIGKHFFQFELILIFCKNNAWKYRS
jgi:hypothetical protein